MAKIIKLKTPDVVWLADVTHMTVLNWRKGAARKTRALPADVGQSGDVSFRAVSLRAWAKENGVELRMDPVEYLAKLNTGGNPRKRPGPKPKVVDVEARAKVEKARDKERIETKHAARKVTADTLALRGNLAPDLSEKGSRKTKPAPRKRSKPIKKALLEASVKVQQRNESKPSEGKPEAKSRRPYVRSFTHALT